MKTLVREVGAPVWSRSQRRREGEGGIQEDRDGTGIGRLKHLGERTAAPTPSHLPGGTILPL